jgi:hypothetical protein
LPKVVERNGIDAEDVGATPTASTIDTSLYFEVLVVTSIAKTATGVRMYL